MGKIPPRPFSPLHYLVFGWLILICAAYGRLLLHPDLHTACPENDIWNLPVRWSVLASLREGKIPLWNPLLAFGFPWMAHWTTECFYPGTLLFTWLGLNAWNLSGVLHLLVFSVGIYRFLRNGGVNPFWAFLVAAIALLNACAYNHLGSNAPTDTMAWMPWLFVATQEVLDQKPWGGLKFALFLALQVFTGYVQLVFYSLLGCLLFAAFSKGWRACLFFLKPIGAALLVASCQLIPSLEYYLFNCGRLPAVLDNPHFLLPLENLKTFIDINALAKDGLPDYVVSPTFFYFNFYSGLVPLAILAWGVGRFPSLGDQSRFFILAFFFSLIWNLGLILPVFHFFHLSFPSFLEPAKAWVLTVVFELVAVGRIIQDLIPKPEKWKWAVLLASTLNLLYPIWLHPVEKNLTPPSTQLDLEARKIKDHLGTGRVLILADQRLYPSIHSPLPGQGEEPLFKHFTPNSNMYVFLPVANFNGSTWPTWGAMDAEYYLQYGFPYRNKALLDLLGIDLFLLTENQMPKSFEKVWSEDVWTLWKNPGSLGSHFMFFGTPRPGTRKEAFEAFTNSGAEPLKDLYLYPQTLSLASRYASPPQDAENFGISGNQKGVLVVTQNAMPGWRAWVDGRPTELYLADGIFQGIPFPEGAKEVRLAYEPASFRLGLFLTLLSLGIFGFLWAGLISRPIHGPTRKPSGA